MKRLWVTGYRSYELSIFSDKDPKLTVIKYTLTNYFKSLLEEGKIDWIISGANLGIEQWALRTCRYHRPFWRHQTTGVWHRIS